MTSWVPVFGAVGAITLTVGTRIPLSMTEFAGRVPGTAGKPVNPSGNMMLMLSTPGTSMPD